MEGDALRKKDLPWREKRWAPVHSVSLSLSVLTLAINPVDKQKGSCWKRRATLLPFFLESLWRSWHCWGFRPTDQENDWKGQIQFQIEAALALLGGEHQKQQITWIIQQPVIRCSREISENVLGCFRQIQQWWTFLKWIEFRSKGTLVRVHAHVLFVTATYWPSVCTTAY